MNAMAEAASLDTRGIANAINRTVAWINANPGTSGARDLARVLLHAYNHYDQPLDITDLCTLDDNLEVCAWAILRLRAMGREPQHFITNQAAFGRIVDEYWVEVTP